ncbi:MAG: hypothetical protein RIT04_304 [Candidatus Parcubacteria bacterium]|jgi:uncharacterized protein YpmS
MTQALTQQARRIMNYREAIFFILVAFFGMSLCWYVYSVRAAIVNVVERESIIKEIQKKSTAVAELESTYFSLKNAVNIELAHKDGFRDTPISMFISKKTPATALSFNK